MKDTLELRDKLIIASRNALSVLPKLGLVKKPNFHKEGSASSFQLRMKKDGLNPAFSPLSPWQMKS